jgi:hypothetical protein
LLHDLWFYFVGHAFCFFNYFSLIAFLCASKQPNQSYIKNKVRHQHSMIFEMRFPAGALKIEQKAEKNYFIPAFDPQY